MAVPSWKKRAEKRPPDIDDCIEQLQLLGDEKPKSIKTLGQLYVAALGFLYHLRLDQETIFSIRRKAQSNKDANRFPNPKEIPAMTAVLHNQSLFRSLVSCLKSNSLDGFESSATSASSTSASQANSFYIPGRKRGLSFDNKGFVSTEISSNKSLKSIHGQSPMVSKRTTSYATKPQMNIKIVAATILYVAMEPLDHWPVPLVEVYAEDCFGPRTWVDHPACRLFVQNLSLIHREDTDSDHKLMDEYSAKLEEDGSKVAAFYRNEYNPPQILSTMSTASRSPRSTPTPMLGDISGRKRSLSTGSESSKAARLSPVSRSKSVAQAKATVKSFMRSKNDGDTSDSGDEEEVAITTSLSSKALKHDDGSSSSSGEDEEMCVMNQRSLDSQREMASNALHSAADESSTSEPPPPSMKLTYPLQQQKLNFARVRQRYFGQNIKDSYIAVSKKLNERLDIKSKQNSGLLHCLPYFISIPRVRTIAAANLEKWLQSPALSGLARTLFSETVNNMKNVDPPLAEDLEALDNILRMRLKANQLNAHIGNITAVATKIPTLSVTKHIYGHLLREILMTMDSHDSKFSDHLAMIHAVHEVLPGELCANGIATSILDMLIKPPESLDEFSKPQLVRRIQKLIQFIAKKFGSSFDAHAVLKAMLSYKVDPEILWTLGDEENKARIMFQCVTLLVDDVSIAQRMDSSGKSVKTTSPSETDIPAVKAKLVEARKLLVRWCCVDYAPLCPSLFDKSKRSGSPNQSQRKKKDEITGAGPPDYSSILDGVGVKNFPRWVEVIRCMLFLESSESPILRHFFSMGDTLVEDLPEWENEAKRIDFCCDYGADVDDEMIWVILKTATKENRNKTNDIALMVLEHIFEGCKINSKPSLLIQDSKLLLKLYDLVEYIPPVKKAQSGSDNVADSSHEKSDEEDAKIPRLGYPGMWWRVTGLALIMCGASPNIIGAVALEKFPTLKALIKMITSDRYRFPTVDCDDAAREEQKKIEQAMRDEEARITEYLFAPRRKMKKQSKLKIDKGNQFSGHRSSKRQREKREQELKRQREKEEAEAHMEANRRKKLLRTAQKSITIWDPKEGPRKPPKESADLIFSIGELFDLPRVFQRSIEPDFVLVTIGSTTRGAIERAHDWLIPIISFLPGTISRLPASASCFLLLRAYDTHTGEDQSQLQELSAPLLKHVRDSLVGKFGEADAVRAFDLLLTDIASHNADRRRCARRVLTNAIGKEDLNNDMDETFAGSNHAWAINLMYVEHAKSILGEAVKRLAVAASFERGGNLRYLVLALYKITKFAIENDVLGEWNFASLLIELLSRRPTVFAGALSSYGNLRSLAIKVVSEELKVYSRKKNGSTAASGDIMVDIFIRDSPHDGKIEELTNVQMPLALLQSSCVLLSIWSEDEKNDRDSNYIDGLVRILMKSREAEGNEMNENDVEGLASATLTKTKRSAIPVESWVMLAKSRSDFIAKRAALAAPTSFLPRLLLCSGLPRASLLTMVDRLGKLGDKAADGDKTFNQLLVPSASSEWDLGRLGHRRDIARKLFGRISAYSRMYNIDHLGDESDVSLSFVEWLSNMCHSANKSTTTKVKKPKLAPAAICASIESAKSLFDQIPMYTADIDEIANVTQMDADASDMTKFMGLENKDAVSPPKSMGETGSVEHFLRHTFEENNPDTLDKWLHQFFFEQHLPVVKKNRGIASKTSSTLNNEELSFLLLQCYIQLERKVEGIASSLVKWIPKLTSSCGSPRLWKILFADGQKPAFMWDNLVSRCFQIWNRTHTAECRRWILSHDTREKLDLVKVVRFLIQASTFTAIHVERFEDLPVAVEDLTWGRTEETVRSATGFALDCLLSHEYERRLRSRSDPPECLVLLLLMSRLGRNQVQFISGAIGKRIENDNKQEKRVLLLSLLRIYTYFPLSMNLGAAVLRSNLMEAVEVSSDDWLSWRSPQDDSMEETIDSAFSNSPSQRSIQSLIDTGKKHPLLLLRKLNKMECILEKDATVCDNEADGDTFGLITGQGLNEPLSATVNGKRMKVSVKYWGYNYREHVWATILDVISAVPNEVLFQCGLKMGVLNLLGVYLRLVLVQSQLRTKIDRLAKLKERLSEFLEKFKSSNLKAYDLWMASSNSGLPSLGATRNILVGCGFISPQQAMESVKKAYT